MQPPTLSRREREALGYAARGLTAKETGRRMGISPRTVAHTLGRARIRLGVWTTAEAVELARRELEEG